MTLAIVDADILLFTSCPPKRYMLDEKTQVIKLDEDGKRIPYEQTPEEEEEYLEEAWKNFTKQLSDVPERAWCSSAIAAIGGVPNFRQEIFPDYKLTKTREDSKYANKAVPIMRKRAVEQGLCMNAVGYEADDLVRIWAEQARAAEIDFVICSSDKDLRCIEGSHFLLHNRFDSGQDHERVAVVDEQEANYTFCSQLIIGDTTDNIPGVPGIGKKRAEKFVTPDMTLEQMQEGVCEAYFSKYGPDFVHYLLLNGKLIHILRTPDDFFRGEGWGILEEL